MGSLLQNASFASPTLGSSSLCHNIARLSSPQTGHAVDVLILHFTRKFSWTPMGSLPQNASFAVADGHAASLRCVVVHGHRLSERDAGGRVYVSTRQGSRPHIRWASQYLCRLRGAHFKGASVLADVLPARHTWGLPSTRSKLATSVNGWCIGRSARGAAEHRCTLGRIPKGLWSRK